MFYLEIVNRFYFKIFAFVGHKIIFRFLVVLSVWLILIHIGFYKSFFIIKFFEFYFIIVINFISLDIKWHDTLTRHIINFSLSTFFSEQIVKQIFLDFFFEKISFKSYLNFSLLKQFFVKMKFLYSISFSCKFYSPITIIICC